MKMPRVNMLCIRVSYINPGLGIHKLASELVICLPTCLSSIIFFLKLLLTITIIIMCLFGKTDAFVCNPHM